MAALVIPPVKRPAKHPRRQPIVLPPQLDKSCVLCLLPLRDSKWYDYSGKGNHGAIIGATWVGKGRRGPALYFDGIDDYVDCGVHPSLNFGSGDFSVEVWIWGGSMSGNRGIVGKWSGSEGWALITATNGRPFFKVNDGTSQVAIVGNIVLFDIQRWVHVVAVYAGSEAKIKIFEDGSVKEKTITPLGNYDVTNDLWVGAVRNYYPINGMLDEVRIFNRALTADEIRALYELGR